MKAYMGKFIKKDGSERNMLFCKLQDLPESFFVLNTKSENSKPKNYPDGMELVWSIDDNGFRTFNYKTMVGKLKEVNVEDLV